MTESMTTNTSKDSDFRELASKKIRFLNRNFLAYKAVRNVLFDEFSSTFAYVGKNSVEKKRKRTKLDWIFAVTFQLTLPRVRCFSWNDAFPCYRFVKIPKHVQSINVRLS